MVLLKIFFVSFLEPNSSISIDFDLETLNDIQIGFHDIDNIINARRILASVFEMEYSEDNNVTQKTFRMYNQFYVWCSSN